MSNLPLVGYSFSRISRQRDFEGVKIESGGEYSSDIMNLVKDVGLSFDEALENIMRNLEFTLEYGFNNIFTSENYFTILSEEQQLNSWNTTKNTLLLAGAVENKNLESVSKMPEKYMKVYKIDRRHGVDLYERELNRELRKRSTITNIHATADVNGDIIYTVSFESEKLGEK